MIRARQDTASAAFTTPKEATSMTRSRTRNAIAALAVSMGALLALSGPASAEIVHQQEGSFAIDTGSINFLSVDNSAGPHSGNLWIGELSFSTFASRVYETDETGTPTGVELDGSATPAGSFGFIDFSTFAVASGPAVDSSTGANAGDIYVPDIQNGVVDRFNPDGTYDCQITGQATPSGSECAGTTGSEVSAGGLAPTSVAVDPADGSVAVGDSASGVVYLFNAGGEFSGQITDAHITDPLSLAFDSTGSLYVVNAKPLTSSEGNAVKFDSAGSFQYELPASGEVLGSTTDLSNDHVYLGTNTQAEEFDSAGNRVSTFADSVLSPDVNQTTRQVYVIASGEGQIWSEPLVRPDVTTGPATEIGETEATLTGEVSPDAENGGGDVTGCEFHWGPTDSYGQTAACEPPTPYSETTEVSARIPPAWMSLAPSTTYHYKLTAENANGANEGADRTFTTRGPAGVENLNPRTVGATSAIVQAKINPFGYETSCEVQYVDDATFGASGFDGAASTPCAKTVDPGFESRTVGARVEGLETDTTYHYRFVATNEGGVTEGAARTLETFGIESFSIEALDENGDPYTQAGGHPYELRTDIQFNTMTMNVKSGEKTSPAGNVRNVFTELPAGLVGDPTATPKCSRLDMLQRGCSAATQVGVVQLTGTPGGGEQPVYNLVPPAGVPARFGFLGTTGVAVFLDATVRSGGDYGITAVSPRIGQLAGVYRVELTMWGVPADDSHDARRVCSRSEQQPGQPASPCPLKLPPRPFLTNPTSCSGDLTARLRADSWQEPGAYVSAEDTMSAITGCDRVPFDPTVSIEPTTSAASSPTGLQVALDLPQPGLSNPDGLGSAHLKQARIVLPEGVSLNPSGAHGLEACAPSEIALDSAAPAQCPDASKIGAVRIDTPLLDVPVTGGVFLAAQNDNPFGSTFAIYIAAKARGVVVKLAGRVTADPNTGQLVTTFADNPQLPFDRFALRFKGGGRAPLAMPVTCGTHPWSAQLSGWSAQDPESPTDDEIARDGGAFQLTEGPNGSACAPTKADRPFEPQFAAGLRNPQAGAHSPFVVRLRRSDQDQELRRLDVEMPEGVLAKLAGVPLCSEADAAAASCGAESRVGQALAASGAGPDPYWVTDGSVHLTGPYKGAPLGLSIVVPAVAGPFDLGEVAVRAALHVDPRTAQVSVVSDPIPQIVEGVPLRTREIRIRMNREGFTLAPTDCSVKQVLAEAHGASGATASLSQRFQVGGCEALGFQPSLGFEVTGTGRSVHPELIASLAPRAGDANIAKAFVRLPDSLFLDQGNLANICTRPDYAAENCPANSQIGEAEATSPLLDDPIAGNVYLVASDNPLPDLVADLNGQIDIDLHGVIFSGGGRIGNDFLLVPDAPVDSFDLTLKGGPGGLLVNSRPLCAERQNRVARTRFVGHNGAVQTSSVLFQADECLRARLRQIVRRARVLARMAERAEANGNTRRARRLRVRSRQLVQRAARARARL